VVLMARVEAWIASRFSQCGKRQRTRRVPLLGLPVVMPETAEPETNVYDMRLTAHQDGWVYGLFCAERKDPRLRRRSVVGRGTVRIARTAI